MTEPIVDQLVVRWAALAADTSALRGAPPLDQPGGRDWLQVRLMEAFRAGIGAEVSEILERTLPLPVAGLCVRDIVRACNAEYTPIGMRIAAAAATGEQFDVTAAVTEELPYLRERIELAIERAVARG